METLQMSSFGEPIDVVELAEIVSREPGPGQLEVAIEAATINPSDLMLIRGMYGVRPELPAALGAEGVGRVVAVGEGVNRSRVGTRVLGVPTLAPGAWVAQTGASSATAGYVLALAKHAGLRTLNVVRRAESAKPLLDAGADVVLVEGADLTEQA